MDKQKNELAWLIFQEADCSLSGEDCGIIADLLIDKGYRKYSAPDVAEVRHGKWIEVDDGILIYNGNHLECSECRAWKRDWQKSNYCPNCGAEMNGKG